MTELDRLESQVSICKKCPLHETARNKVFGSGNPSAAVMIVGEAPGRDENASGLPFVGEAGQLLDKAFAKLGVDRASLYICNILKCQPPGNRRPEPSETQSCIGWLEQQIRIVKPKVLIVLGATAMQVLAEIHSSIGKMRGKMMAGPEGVLMMPTWHPAYLLRMGGIGGDKARQRQTAKEFIADLTAAFSVAGVELKESD